MNEQLKRDGEQPGARLEAIRERLDRISDRLSDPELPDGEASGLADEAAGLAGEAVRIMDRLPEREPGG